MSKIPKHFLCLFHQQSRLMAKLTSSLTVTRRTKEIQYSWPLNSHKINHHRLTVLSRTDPALRWKTQPMELLDIWRSKPISIWTVQSQRRNKRMPITARSKFKLVKTIAEWEQSSPWRRREVVRTLSMTGFPASTKAGNAEMSTKRRSSILIFRTPSKANTVKSSAPLTTAEVPREQSITDLLQLKER